MPIPPGTRIGVNEIVSLIGAGGMGEVYRAHDVKLGRDVAIKVLATRLTDDAVVRARIDREARLLASLNHPNIATIYSVEEFQGTPAIAMELIEGETLAIQLLRGALPIERVMAIGRQVADALSAAHERGIVHRDLKPANVHVRPDGTVKVLDFGLAKAVSQSDTKTPVTPTVTTTGSIVGTASYMSPEQARGQDVDRRSDIWSFGCMVFEMLTGQPPFVADTAVDTLVAVLKHAPDWSRLPADTPPRLRTLLERCLQKDVGQRLSDLRAIDFSRRIPASWSPPRFRSRSLKAAALIGVTVAALGGVVWTLVDRDPSAAPLRKFQVVADGLQVLHRTAYLAKRPNRRLFETAQFIVDVLSPGGLGPGGKGVRAAQKVRLMHASIRHLIQADVRAPWSVAELGVPINQEDLLGTLMTFTWIILDGLAKLGVTLSPGDQQAYLTTWLLVGEPMGVEPDLMPRSVAEARATTELIERRQVAESPQGREMMAALLDMMQSNTPPPFKTMPPALLREFLPPNVATFLGVASHPFEEEMIRLANDALHPLQRFVNREAQRSALVRRFSIELLRWMLKVGLDGQPSRFAIPDSLHQDWQIAPPDSEESFWQKLHDRFHPR